MPHTMCPWPDGPCTCPPPGQRWQNAPAPAPAETAGATPAEAPQ